MDWMGFNLYFVAQSSGVSPNYIYMFYFQVRFLARFEKCTTRFNCDWRGGEFMEKGLPPPPIYKHSKFFWEAAKKSSSTSGFSLKIAKNGFCQLFFTSQFLD